MDVVALVAVLAALAWLGWNFRQRVLSVLRGGLAPGARVVVDEVSRTADLLVEAAWPLVRTAMRSGDEPPLSFAVVVPVETGRAVVRDRAALARKATRGLENRQQAELDRSAASASFRGSRVKLHRVDLGSLGVLVEVADVPAPVVVCGYSEASARDQVQAVVAREETPAPSPAPSPARVVADRPAPAVPVGRTRLVRADEPRVPAADRVPVASRGPVPSAVPAGPTRPAAGAIEVRVGLPGGGERTALLRNHGGLTVGRNPSCTIQVPAECDWIGGSHLELRRSGSAVRVVDTSTSGVWRVRAGRLVRVVAGAGEQLGVGDILALDVARRVTVTLTTPAA